MKKWLGIGKKGGAGHDEGRLDGARSSTESKPETRTDSRSQGGVSTPGGNTPGPDSTGHQHLEGSSSKPKARSSSKSDESAGQHVKAASTESKSGSRQPKKDFPSGTAEQDTLLESLVNKAMEHLANEGLVQPRLFRATAPRSAVLEIVNGAVTKAGYVDRLDLVSRDDASVTSGVLIEALSRFSTPVFPIELLDTFEGVLTSIRNKPNADPALLWRPPLVKGLKSKQITPMFLNLLGLFNLVLQHSKENNVTSSVIEDSFAPFFLEGQGRDLEPDLARKRLSTAAAVLRDLVLHVYKIFQNKVPLQILWLTCLLPFMS